MRTEDLQHDFKFYYRPVSLFPKDLSQTHHNATRFGIFTTWQTFWTASVSSFIMQLWGGHWNMLDKHPVTDLYPCLLLSHTFVMETPLRQLNLGSAPSKLSPELLSNINVKVQITDHLRNSLLCRKERCISGWCHCRCPSLSLSAPSSVATTEPFTQFTGTGILGELQSNCF